MLQKNRGRVVSRPLLCVLALAAALPARAFPGSDGGVVGWVEDAKGAPVAGALVSLFGAGLRGGGFVTLSDGSGRFFLPALPAGSYTLRALGSDRVTTRQITVLPNRDSIFTLSFAAAAQKVDSKNALEPTSPSERELNWLLRHKRRSVLEARSPEAETAKVADSIPASHNLLETLVPWVPELRGAVELMAAPSAAGARPEQSGLDLGSPSLGSLKLDGRLADDGRWSVGGLIADRERAAWRMAAEFILAPGSGHELQAGAGYGSRSLDGGFPAAGSGRLDNRTVGALFVSDRWTATDKLTLSGGGRYSYLGFVSDKTAFSPMLAVEYRTGEHSRVRGNIQARTLAPGGDLLTASTVQATPAMAVALVGERIRPERITRQDLALDRSVGRASFGAFVFREGVRDRLRNDLGGPSTAQTLRITNAPGLVAYGGGFNAAGQFGGIVKASLTYTQGRSRGAGFDEPRRALDPARANDGSFRDVVTRLETFVDWSGTRLVAYYRVNSWASESEARTSPVLSQRFDVQLTQGLPFLRSMTRTEWEVLVAFRNMFYEAAEAGLLDEVAIANPPKRLVGGISVRF